MNLTGEELKAWSQNLGHEHIATTIISYGTLTVHRQEEILKNIMPGDKSEPTLTDIMKAIKEAQSD